MHRVRAVVFDMDGTLLNSTECVVAAYQYAAAAAGAARPAPRDVVASYPLGPPRIVLSHLLSRESTDTDEQNYLTGLAANHSRVSVYEGVRELLSALAEQGCRLGIFTGASAAAARQLLGAMDLLSPFGVVVGGDEVPVPKPDPGGILLALERLNIEPDKAAYVGDSPLDLEAAVAAGTFAVAAAWGHLYDESISPGLLARRPLDLLSVLTG